MKIKNQPTAITACKINEPFSVFSVQLKQTTSKFLIIFCLCHFCLDPESETNYSGSRSRKSSGPIRILIYNNTGYTGIHAGHALSDGLRVACSYSWMWARTRGTAGQQLPPPPPPHLRLWNNNFIFIGECVRVQGQCCEYGYGFRY